MDSNWSSFAQNLRISAVMDELFDAISLGKNTNKEGASTLRRFRYF